MTLFHSFCNVFQQIYKIIARKSLFTINLGRCVLLCKLNCIYSHVCLIHHNPYRHETKGAFAPSRAIIKRNHSPSRGEGEKVTRALRLVSPTCLCIDPRNCEYLPCPFTRDIRVRYTLFPSNFAPLFFLFPFFPLSFLRNSYSRYIS